MYMWLHQEHVMLTSVKYLLMFGTVTTLDAKLDTNKETMVADVDECASTPCQNDRPCEDAVNGYSCDCGYLFTGVNCERGQNLSYINTFFILL